MLSYSQFMGKLVGAFLYMGMVELGRHFFGMQSFHACDRRNTLFLL